MDEDFVNFVKDANVASQAQEKLTQEIESLRKQIIADVTTLNQRAAEKIPLMTQILSDVLSKTTDLSKTDTLPVGSVPLYFTPSILMNHANGEVYQTVGAVNTRSLDVIKENNNIDTTDLIKILSKMDPETSTEFVTIATIFGILRITRITIPISNISRVLQHLTN